METIGERLKRLRESMNLSQDDLANYLNISQTYVSLLESRDRKLNLRILDKLSALYGCTITYLLCKDNSYKPRKFAFRSNNIEVKDLECVATINKLLMNMQYMNNLKNKED